MKKTLFPIARIIVERRNDYALFEEALIDPWDILRMADNRGGSNEDRLLIIGIVQDFLELYDIEDI